jgi:NCS1 nucleoside transporter family
VGYIPLAERHGRPLQMFWTWTSPNLEFATIFLGVLAVAAFGLSFWQAVAAIVVGTGLGSLSHGLLSARGPRAGVPQMVLSRLPFGFLGNILPAGLNSATAGIGWYAVNSVSGAFALNTLTHLPKPACLVIIALAQVAVAFFGHNLVHVFERYAFGLLAVVFAITTVVLLAKSHPNAPGAGGGTGGFLLTVGAVFGYAAGWNPYATDYTRYLPQDSNRRQVGLWSGLGVFVSCLVLETLGAASATLGGNALGDPTGTFTSHLSTGVADLTLLAIALGAVSANVLNIYSGALSFVALGVRLPLALRRAIVALGFGVVGFVVAVFGLHDAGAKYESFLLIIGYWIGPWLAVVFTDWVIPGGMSRRPDATRLLYSLRHRNWPGPVAMLLGITVSVLLFSNQTRYVGPVPEHVPSVGDLTFEVGFVLTAVLYWALTTVRNRRTGQPPDPTV